MALEDGGGETEGGDVVGGVEQLQLHVGELGVENVLRQTHWKIERIILRLVGLARHGVNDARGKTSDHRFKKILKTVVT